MNINFLFPVHFHYLFGISARKTTASKRKSNIIYVFGATGKVEWAQKGAREYYMPGEDICTQLLWP
jgi:hypothetical protein